MNASLSLAFKLARQLSRTPLGADEQQIERFLVVHRKSTVGNCSLDIHSAGHSLEIARKAAVLTSATAYGTVRYGARDLRLFKVGGSCEKGQEPKDDLIYSVTKSLPSSVRMYSLSVAVPSDSI